MDRRYSAEELDRLSESAESAIVERIGILPIEVMDTILLTLLAKRLGPDAVGEAPPTLRAMCDAVIQARQIFVRLCAEGMDKVS